MISTYPISILINRGFSIDHLVIDTVELFDRELVLIIIRVY